VSEPVRREDGETEGLHADPVQEVARNGDAIVVRLAGELDLYNAEVVRQALIEAASGDPDRLVVDLGAVEFLDSTALGVLVEARSKLRDRGAFRLAAPGLEPRRALEVAGLDRHFSVHETVEDALAAEL
jgi:anti-sigma B factor antagonist